MTGSYPEIEQKGLGLAQDWSPTWALGWEVGGVGKAGAMAGGTRGGGVGLTGRPGQSLRRAEFW